MRCLWSDLIESETVAFFFYFAAYYYGKSIDLYILIR